MSTPRKSKSATPAKFAESCINKHNPDVVGFDDGLMGHGSWVKAEKRYNGVLIEAADFGHALRLSPEHARLLGQTLIKWADELEGKK